MSGTYRTPMLFVLVTEPSAFLSMTYMCCTSCSSTGMNSLKRRVSRVGSATGMNVLHALSTILPLKKTARELTGQHLPTRSLELINEWLVESCSGRSDMYSIVRRILRPP